MQQKTTIELTEYIDAAHHLPDTVSLTTKKCLNLHGHTYGIRMKVEAEKLIDGFVVDFGTLKELVNRLDHATIVWDMDTDLLDYLKKTNSKHFVLPYPPTAENIAHGIFDMLEEHLPLNCTVLSVSVEEGTKPGKNGWNTYEVKPQ